MLVKTWDNKKIKCDLPEEFAELNLLALPALIDPHVHFRVPGGEHKEDWITGSAAALAGGVTTVFDMPNNSPSVTTLELLKQKKETVNKQLKKLGQKIRPYFYFGATPDNLDELEKVTNKIIGVKMCMGASTGNLLVSEKNAQKKIFQKCAKLNLVLAVHAEDDEIIRANSPIVIPTKVGISVPTVIPSVAEESLNVKHHSQIRSRTAATKAVAQVIELAKKYGTKLYILHVSTAEELKIIKAAKSAGVKVFAEVTPHHLFLDESAYEKLGAKAQMNPPLRTTADCAALWQGIADGTIDTIGTDHAPHTLAEKSLPYPQSPSGVPGIETCLPLLLNAWNNGKITLEKITQLTHFNIQKIFNLPETNDWVIIDRQLIKIVKNENLKTKCGWSPFAGWKLKGWPIKIIFNQ